MEYTSLSIVIPAYNEAGTIGTIVSNIKALFRPGQNIVVYDGSSDDTEMIAATDVTN